MRAQRQPGPAGDAAPGADAAPPPPAPAAEADQGAPRAAGKLREALRKPSFVIPVLALATLTLVAVFAPLLAPHSPTQSSVLRNFLPPFWVEGGEPAYILGTDSLGRDILSRMIFGARISLSVAAVVILIAGLVGALLGILAGYFGGWVDGLVMRAADIVMSFPSILMALVMAVVFGPSFRNIVIVISILIWPLIARQVRGEALAIRQQEFVTYAIVAGVPVWKIMLRHMFPNVVPTLLVVLTLEVGHVVLLEATLSFLGAGIPPPQPSWGLMVSEGRGLLTLAWWIALFPGLAILVTVLCINLLGDWMRDEFDPRLRDR